MLEDIDRLQQLERQFSDNFKKVRVSFNCRLPQLRRAIAALHAEARTVGGIDRELRAVELAVEGLDGIHAEITKE